MYTFSDEGDSEGDVGVRSAREYRDTTYPESRLDSPREQSASERSVPGVLSERPAEKIVIKQSPRRTVDLGPAVAAFSNQQVSTIMILYSMGV